MLKFVRLISLINCFLIFSCNSETPQTRRPRGNANAGASENSNNCSQFNITNGKKTSDAKYNGIARLTMKMRDNQGPFTAYCTGTFIRQNLIITAAHCFIGGEVERVEISYTGGTAVASRILINELFEQSQDLEAVANDLAFLFVSEKQNVNTIPLCSKEPQIGEQATIAGFGKTDNLKPSEIGILREGFTKIAALDPTSAVETHGQVDTTTADGTNASTGEGDSGGPLLLKDSSGKFCVSATTHGGQPLANMDIAYYTYLKSSAAAAFLKRASVTYDETRAFTSSTSGNSSNSCN